MNSVVSAWPENARSARFRPSRVSFVRGAAVTPERFRFSPMFGVIVAGCVASVVSVACIVAMALAVQRKRSRRRRRRCRARADDEAKTAIDGGDGGGGGGDGGTCAADGGAVGAGGGGGGGGADGAIAAVTGRGSDGGGGTDRHLRADAVDEGPDNNPDIIPHDNGKFVHVVWPLTLTLGAAIKVNPR